MNLAFLTLLFDDRLYIPVSELDRGYVDLALILRSDRRRFQALDLALEFNYLSLPALGLSREQVRGQTREDLAQLPAVIAQLDAAEAQARRYGAELCTRYRLSDLRAFAVVAVGLERLVWRGVAIA